MLGSFVDVFGENPEKGATQNEIIGATLKNGQWRGEVINYDSDNNEIILDCRTQQILDKTGVPIALCGISTVITERKKTETALTRLLELSRALSEAKGLEDTMDLCLTAAMDIGDMDCGAVFLVQESPLEVKLIASRGPTDCSPAMEDGNRRHAPDWTALIKRKPVYVQKEEVRKLHQDMPVSIQSKAIIPILHQGRIIACLNLGSRQKDSIDSLVHPYIETLAAQTGGFIARSLAEGALRESEEKFRGFVENSSDIIYSMTAEGVVTYISPNWKNILGHELSDTIGRSFFSFIHSEDVDAYRDYFKEVKEKKRLNYGVEYRTQCSNGEWKWNSSTASLGLESGETPIIIGIARDITERKTTENALRKNENLLRKIFDIIPVGLWLADNKGNLIKANAMGAKIWGAEPLVGPDQYGVFKARRLPSGEELAAEDWALAKTINQGVSILEELLEIDAFDGEKKIIMNSTAPVFDEQGRVEAAVIVNLDVTERHHAEEEKEKLRSELLQVQKLESVGRLAGGVAHDFNNMLQAILGYTELALMDTPLQNPVTESLNQIKISAQRSADLVKQLLAFARKQTINPKVLNLNDSIKNLSSMIQGLLREDIELIWRPGSDLWNIKIDPSQLNQVLANMTANSREAITGSGAVTISTSNQTFTSLERQGSFEIEAGDYVVLSISDTGAGIPRDFLDNIFDPFFTTKEVGEGPGLGLATVYGIVKQNNCAIRVESKLREGTTFSIYFPRFASESAALSGFQPNAHLPRGTETVLLVEDEKQIISLCRNVLTLQGYSVLTALSPKEAVDIARDYGGPINLLLTDVIMPEMNGRELKTRLLTYRPELKCLFMSGYSADIVARSGVIEKGIWFLRKPFSMSELINKVREVLDHETP